MGAKNAKASSPKQNGETQQDTQEPKQDNKLEILEPVSNEGKLFWLVKKTTKKSGSNTNRSIKEIIKENALLIDVVTFELKPAGLWRCNRCLGEFEFNSGTPQHCPKCDRQSSFHQITKEINPDLWRIPKWQDINKMDLKQLYIEVSELIKQLIVFAEPIEYKIFTLWIISTWKLESWETVGFPCFIGLANSGKSTALRIIHYLGYRAPKASGVTMAAIPRLCHYHNVTLLVDEAHNKLDPKTETGSSMLDFIKDSYKRDSTYITCDLNDQSKLIVTKNFGFKAFAGEKITFNPALLTRSFVFWMDKADPPIAKLSYKENELADLQNKLLNYRLKTDAPPDLGNDFILKGRTREIFESIIQTAKHIGIPCDDILQYAIDRDQKEEDDLKNSIPGEILVIIKRFEETLWNNEPDRIDIQEILTELGWSENDSAQKLGYYLKNMGLATKKINRIRYIFIQEPGNSKRLKQLYKRYKLVVEEKQRTL